MTRRVVHVTPYYAPAWVYGGPPRSIHGLCRGLVAAGLDVDVVTTTANGDRDLPATSSAGEILDGVRVMRLPRRRPHRLFNAPLGGAVASALAGADVCHVHGLWNAPEWIATRQARGRSIPYVLSPRGMLLGGALAHHAWRKRLLFGSVERPAIQGASRVHATSTAEANALAPFVDRARVRVVPNGVDLPPDGSTAPDLRGAVGLPADSAVVLFLGRVHPIKRLDLLAAAVVLLCREYPEVRLVVAGPDEGGALRALEPALESLGDAVRIVGHVSDAEKWAWLRESTALVCCSDSENFGMSVAEAMAARVPVVVTRTCPWPDVERAGAGFWVPQDAGAIAGALRAIIADRDRARTMGDRGRALIERAYTWQAIGRAMADIYEEIVRERATVVA